MKYKLVIFDFDGTLADSFPYFLSTINILAETYNFPRIEPENVDQLRGMDARQLMKNAQLPAWKVPLIANSFIRLMNRDIDQIQLFKGIPELLKQLSDHGVQLAIVSSNSEENIRRVLGSKNAYLISHYGCGTSLFGKQSKFRKAIAKSGVTPGEVLCVGDEIRDLEAAKEASIAFGAVSWGYTRVDALEAYPGVELFYHADDIVRAVLGK
ncbi:HAD-IA family hydrolase [Spirosoma validum]|uniref:HAD-IA family hydrolase n=1 Tax=Spirosoma validum TaxID=2771355 RepID=A0A927GCR5_9BACT|nr:HAD-IA family hydrolase [Spirosoma validum]MBD2752934.1 HAD-IA family hydrolase [Spirosoma validum]